MSKASLIFNTRPSAIQKKSTADVALQRKLFEECKSEIITLRDAIDAKKDKEQKTILLETTQKSSPSTPPRLPSLSFATSLTMQGHLGKIYDTDYSSDSKLLLSCSQDGHLIIWDAASGNQMQSYELPSDNVWIQACAFSPSTRYVACGGLDNVCSIYQYGTSNASQTSTAAAKKLKKRASTYLHSHSTKNQPFTTLPHHEGYLSALCFVSD